MLEIPAATRVEIWAIPQVKNKVPINRRRHTYAEPRTRARGCCFRHARLLSQTASWYAPKQNAVANLTDLGSTLVFGKHSRSTYHNSVRHSSDHSRRLDAGTNKEAPHNKPRCTRRTTISRDGVVMALPPQSGSIAQLADNASVKHPEQFDRRS